MIQKCFYYFLFSDHLKKPLQDYVAKLKNVKVVRTKQREGLIRARLLGYSASSGTVLTYLDSHCECAEGRKPVLLSNQKEVFTITSFWTIMIIIQSNRSVTFASCWSNWSFDIT